MSDDIIASSIIIQRVYLIGVEYSFRHICARFKPVTTPSRADSSCRNKPITVDHLRACVGQNTTPHHGLG